MVLHQWKLDVIIFLPKRCQAEILKGGNTSYLTVIAVEFGKEQKQGIDGCTDCLWLKGTKVKCLSLARLPPTDLRGTEPMSVWVKNYHPLR